MFLKSFPLSDAWLLRLSTQLVWKIWSTEFTSVYEMFKQLVDAPPPHHQKKSEIMTMKGMFYCEVLLI